MVPQIRTNQRTEVEVEWVLFRKNCTALWNRNRTQLFPLISICQLVTEQLSGSFVGLSGLHHICCAMSGDLSREDCVHNTNWVPKKLKSRWTWTEGTRPSSWSTNWTDLYYKHKHKRRPVISQMPSCFFCLPKCNFAQRSSDEHSSNLLFPLECTREQKW